MLVVSGSRRSGTSLWMQLLAAAGIEWIGEEFPLDWGTTLRDLNPRGFFESKLRDGIHWQSNPDPDSGVYLHPKECPNHAVKIFPMGLVRTDLAFIDKVLVSYRPWRAQAASTRRFFDVEAKAARQAGIEPPPLRDPVSLWFRDLYLLFEDFERRRYPVHVQPLPALMKDPESVLVRVFAWLDLPRQRPLDELLPVVIAVIEPGLLNRAHHESPDLSLESEHDAATIRVLDDLDHALATDGAVPEALLGDMNELILRLLPRLREEDERQDAWMSEQLRAASRKG